MNSFNKELLSQKFITTLVLFILFTSVSRAHVNNDSKATGSYFSLLVCNPPSGIMTSAITSAGATVTWSASPSNPSGGYDYYVSISSTPPIGATTPTGSVGAGVLTTPVTGLMSNTTYYVWVRGNCGAGDLSTWAGPAQFLTLPAVVMDYVNVQFPASGTIPAGGSLTVYTQGFEGGLTEAAGPGAGITVWIGTNPANTNPATWGPGAWTSAIFNVNAGNNDEFQAAIGNNLSAGTHYYASRWQVNGGTYVYGGYSPGGGGFWNGATNVSGVLTVNPHPNDNCLDYGSLPAIPTNGDCANVLITTAGTTGSADPTCIGTEDDDVWNSFTVPVGFTTVDYSNFNISGSTDIVHQIFTSCGGTSLGCYDAEAGSFTGLTGGVEYFLRSYTKGAGEASSFIFCLKVTNIMDYVNVQFPATATISAGGSLTVYTQGYEPGLTEPAGPGAGITVWIGTNPANTNPNTWGPGVWTPATFNVNVGNDDEFQAAIGNNLTPGTYYYASRWQLSGGNYAYGGYSPTDGGYWNGTTNVSGVLTVNPHPNNDCLDYGSLPAIPTNGECSNSFITTAGGTGSADPTCIGTEDDDVWNSFVVPVGFTTVDYSNFNISGSTDIVHQIFTSCGGTSLGCYDAEAGSFTGLMGGVEYFLRSYTKGAGEASTFLFCLKVTPGLTNNEPTTPIVIVVGNGCGGASYTNVGATTAPMEPTNSGGVAYKTVWFTFVAPASGAVRISTDVGTGNTLTDSRVALYSATNPADFSTFTVISSDEDGGSFLGSGFMSVVYATGLTAGNTYYIQVGTFNNSTTEGVFCLAVEELGASMLATTATCASTPQNPAGTNPAYTGWVPILDASSKLIALVRNLTGASPNTYTNHDQYINSGPVRQDGSGKYYLDRNFAFKNVTAGNYQAQVFYLQSERTALTGVDPTAANIGNLNITRDPEVGCIPYPTGANNPTIIQSGNGSVGGAEWVSFNTSSFSGFFLRTGLTPLPVTIISFDAKAVNEKLVNLTWNVSDEINVKEYIVERSFDNNIWIAIGSVDANQKPAYAFTDNSPLKGMNYYRLAVKDLNAGLAYSQIRSVNFSGKAGLALYPNPAKSQVFISGSADKNVVATVYNEVGQILRTLKMSGDNLASQGIDISTLVPGAYSIQIKGEASVNTMRFVKVRY